ncbi:Uncharacterised protein [uncultured archaeon]|nr:Uncharacterised protein [uncultured archaeon]
MCLINSNRSCSLCVLFLLLAFSQGCIETTPSSNTPSTMNVSVCTGYDQSHTLDCYYRTSKTLRNSSICLLIDEKYMLRYFCLEEMNALDNQTTKIIHQCTTDSECVMFGPYPSTCINRRYSDRTGFVGPFWSMITPLENCGDSCCHCINNQCTAVITKP